MTTSPFHTLNTLIPALALLAQVGAASALEVVKLVPAAQRLAVPVDSPLGLQFDQDIDPASVDADSFRVLGRWTGVVAGGFEVEGNKIRFTPARAFSPGDWVTVRLTSDIRSIGGESLQGGYSWNFWTASAAAGMVFTETGTLSPGLVPYGAHGGDIDHDGDLDLAVPNEISADMAVYLNDGSGNYGPPAMYDAAFRASPIEAADLDGDTHIDLVVGNLGAASVSVYMGHGDGSFDPQVLLATGTEPRGIATTDLDADGDLDMLVTNRISDDLSMFRGAGDGSFEAERRADPPGDGETAIVATDVNNDGLEDLIVGYYQSQEIRTWLATGIGRYTQASVAATGGQLWQMAVGDLNGDGLVDAVSANSDTQSAGVLLAEAPGVLTDAVIYPAGSFPIAIDLGDLDGDGDLDLVISSFSGGSFTVYRNDGSGVFTDRQDLAARDTGSCAVLHDRDGDGDLDITGIDERANLVLLFRND